MAVINLLHTCKAWLVNVFPDKAASMTHRPSSFNSRDIASYFQPYTNLKTAQEARPNIITGGNGVEVYGQEGEVYIEALAG